VLLRKCVIAKLGYLSHTIRPDLALPALKRADDLCAAAFCTIYSVNRAIFDPEAPAEQRFAATRVRLPTSLQGCGIRSAVATSDATYVACWRSVAPAIAKASSPSARAALTGLGDGQPAAPCLRTLAAAALRVATLLPAADRHLVALDDFCTKPAPGIQRKITHSSEAATCESATAALRPSDTMSAFLRSCDGRWVRAARLKHMQLSNEEVVVRMQRYLRQPLSALAGLVGKLSLDVSGSTTVDPYGDCFLSKYAAKDDGEWRHLHDALCRALSGFASRAHLGNKLEGGKVSGTRKKPGDVRFYGDSGAHGWARAGSRELWVDLTVVCPLLISYINAARHTRGAAAAAAANGKRNKYINDIPGFAYFLPLPSKPRDTCAMRLSSCSLASVKSLPWRHSATRPLISNSKTLPVVGSATGLTSSPLFTRASRHAPSTTVLLHARTPSMCPSAETPWWMLIVLARRARCRRRRTPLPLPRAPPPPLRLPRKGPT